MIIIGYNFHSRFQKIALLDTERREIEERRLEHKNGEAGEFYRGLKEPALVGMESTGYAIWFAERLSERGHQLVVGDAARIRAQVVRKQKTDAYAGEERAAGAGDDLRGLLAVEIMDGSRSASNAIYPCERGWRGGGPT